MTAAWRLVLVALIILFVLSGFLLGISQYPDRLQAPFVGVSAGLFSAVCWACTGISFHRWRAAEIDGTTGVLNFVAAIFAAVAVGYLAPQEMCAFGPSSPLRSFVCSFYPRVESRNAASPPTPH